MLDFLSRLFDSSDFIARRDCGTWSQGHVLLHNAADGFIWLSYMAIPVMLVYFVRRKRNVPFHWMFLMFGLFIVSCGFTHLMELLMFYVPVYRLDGLVKLVTAGASVATVIALAPVIPRALTMRFPEELEREIAERRKAEDALQRANAYLAEEAQQRTAELVEANRALRQEVETRRHAEEQLRLAVVAAGLGTWHWDLLTDHLEWSPACKALFGLRPDAAVDYERFLQALHPDDRRRIDQAVRTSLRECGDYDVEYRTVWPDGSVRWLAARGKPILGPTGGLARMEGVALDISARKELEHQLRVRAEELTENDRRKDEFLAMLSHELRNPLAPIRNAVQVMKLVNHGEPRLAWARDIIDRQVEHVSRLVDDLLDVSRFTRGKVRLSKVLIDLAKVMHQSVEACRPLAEARKQRLTVATPEAPIWLEADPTRLAQIVGNLLSNAVKYTDQGGQISLTASLECGQAVVRLRDNGVGISSEFLPHVFELFTQGDRSLDRSQGGLGIGLTLARTLAELHGGSLSAHSDGPGQGSEFVLRLPLAGLTLSSAANDAAASSVAAPTSRRVLVVDDNPDAVDSLAVLLRAEGHVVEIAFDGSGALVVASRFRPDVIFLDIGLPGMDGYEVARRLRREPGPAPWLVALTGYGQEEDRRQALAAGFDEHVVKPASMPRLADLLRRAGTPA
jgi:PAS domain S-box-containing protein